MYDLLMTAGCVVVATACLCRQPAEALPEYSAQTGEPCASLPHQPVGRRAAHPARPGLGGQRRARRQCPALTDALELLGVRLKVDEADFVALPERCQAGRAVGRRRRPRPKQMRAWLRIVCGELMGHLSRRSFIKLTGVDRRDRWLRPPARGRCWTAAPCRGPAGQRRLRRPLEEKGSRTTCALCPSGCGLEVRVVDGQAVKVEGSALHPVNQGVCCLRGQASLEMLYSPERLERPRVRNGSKADARRLARDLLGRGAGAGGRQAGRAAQRRPGAHRGVAARRTARLRCAPRSNASWRPTARPT